MKNALYAVTVGLCCGVDSSSIQAGVMGYSPTGLRQRIYEKDGIRVIADCYNASPESMDASLKVLAESRGRKIAVLGDMLELGDLAQEAHKKVGKTAVLCHTDKLFTYGKVSYHIMLGALDAGMEKENAVNSIDAKQISDMLKETLKPGDTVHTTFAEGELTTIAK